MSLQYNPSAAADTSAEDAHSVVTEVQDAHSEKLPPSSSSSSVPEAIGAASDAASITPEVPCSIPNSVRSGSMTSMSSQKGVVYSEPKKVFSYRLLYPPPPYTRCTGSGSNLWAP